MYISEGNMRKALKKYFIPHYENDYKPHFLHGTNVAVIAFSIIGLLIFSLVYSFVFTKTDFYAAILSGVLVDLANSDRQASGAGSLRINPVLEEVARLKANDMVQDGYFAHVSPDGISPWYWFRAVGYRFTHAGENLAVHFSDSENVEKAWMNSPSHRANILNKYFTEVGIAATKGIYQGYETTFVVQMFARPSKPGGIDLSSVVLPKAGVSGNEAGNKASKAGNEIEAVAGASAGLYSEEGDKSLEIITSDGMFIAVKTADADQLLFEDAGDYGVARYSSVWGRMAASPKNILLGIYFALGALVLIALLLNIFIEFRIQHPIHIFYGLSLLALALLAIYASQTMIFSGAIVL